MNFPVLSKSNGENETNSDKLNNRIKGIRVVETMCLVIAFGHKAGFVTLNYVVIAMLSVKDPFTTNEVGFER